MSGDDGHRPGQQSQQVVVVLVIRSIQQKEIREHNRQKRGRHSIHQSDSNAQTEQRHRQEEQFHPVQREGFDPVETIITEVKIWLHIQFVRTTDNDVVNPQPCDHQPETDSKDNN